MSTDVLIVNVLRYGVDTTNGGVTSKKTAVNLWWSSSWQKVGNMWDVEAARVIRYPEHKEQHDLILCRRWNNYKREGALDGHRSPASGWHYFAVPAKVLESGLYPTFGGNFVHTSDSRFPCDAPIPVHDRVETTLHD